jgi:hypothetical protein
MIPSASICQAVHYSSEEFGLAHAKHPLSSFLSSDKGTKITKGK